jgi:hypothetical protein
MEMVQPVYLCTCIVDGSIHDAHSHITLRVLGSSPMAPTHACISLNVLGKRAGHASELVRISPILPLIINYTTKLEDIGKKQVVLQTTELNTMSNFTTSTTPW